MIYAAVAVHVAMAMPNCLIQETISSDVLTQPIEVRDGYISVPTGPGIGIEINKEAARQHPFKLEAEQRYFHPDGSVADW